MNPERICFGCFQEKEPGGPCPHCGFDENEEQPYLALPLGTLLNGRYMLGKVLGVGYCISCDESGWKYQWSAYVYRL